MSNVLAGGLELANFAKNFEDSLIFFLIVTMKQAKMILVLEILKFDNTQSCPKFRRKLYSYVSQVLN